ncbi:DUF6377 domain-containing protein [Pedobacter lithocola]|uniref:DUF6377 domain-containing protein n=1 Tax=Pedobacter lithocola TaxID=1908239 RepID=A0ABV8PCP0_9SPHI
MKINFKKPACCRLWLFITLLFLVTWVQAETRLDTLKSQLNSVLARKPFYDGLKQKEILSLIEKFRHQELTLAGHYRLYMGLFESYKSFNNDSAYVYCKKAKQCAELLKDKNKVNYAKVNLSFVLISSGMFKEGLDTLKTVGVNFLDQKQRFEYYYLAARANFDLTDYNKIDYYGQLYTQQGLNYCDSIINNYPDNSSQYLSGLGLKLLRSKKYAAAIPAYQKLLQMKSNYRDSAINYSCLSYLYYSINQPEKGLEYLYQSAIIDNVHSIKESLALLNLAKQIYLLGWIKEAFSYIHYAIEDNNFYGAKQRKVEISNILPIIERSKIDDIEKQKRSLIIYASIITLLIILTIYFATTYFRQLNKLRKADKLIIEQNLDLNQANSQLLKINKTLDVANQSLTNINHKLDEANLIKEEYIGYFFNVNATYIEKMDKLKRSLEKIIHAQQYSEIQVILNRLNTNSEREHFYRSFDEVFLKLFPDFIAQFNALFDSEHQSQPVPGQLLNNEIRIFALIRLGIDENETIAKILNYSVNTIYTYKTKVKNRSLIPNDEFKERILSIRAIKMELINDVV